MNEIEAAVILNSIPYLGNTKIGTLIRQFGSCYNALLALYNKDPLPFNLRAETVSFLETFEKNTSWKEDLLLAEQQSVTLLPITSPLYPEKLKAISDCPPLLYIKGILPIESPLSIAIIGTRTATFYGNEQALRFAEALSAAGCTIVSGLARGIDTSAHKGCLKKGKTIAVIGSGLAHIYPEENKNLAQEITQAGAVISELPMNTQPSRFTFPQRNRIISALSDALLLVEAPEKSGAMITMEIGGKQNKALFALPGRAGASTSCGNHLLIKQGKAKLIDHPEEILSAFNYTAKHQTNSSKLSFSAPVCTPPEKKILDILKQSEMSLEQLSGLVSLPIATLQATLIKLALKKLVLELPGKRYTLH
ncbi:MAG: putative Protein smf [Chlamydiia bacterium]|nr:putative Protein smf [Chlamydiia bacterium]